MKIEIPRIASKSDLYKIIDKFYEDQISSKDYVIDLIVDINNKFPGSVLFKYTTETDLIFSKKQIANSRVIVDAYCHIDGDCSYIIVKSDCFEEKSMLSKIKFIETLHLLYAHLKQSPKKNGQTSLYGGYGDA